MICVDWQHHDEHLEHHPEQHITTYHSNSEESAQEATQSNALDLGRDHMVTLWEGDETQPDHHHAYYPHWGDDEAHDHGGPSSHDFIPIRHHNELNSNESQYGLATNNYYSLAARNDVEEAMQKVGYLQ